MRPPFCGRKPTGGVGDFPLSTPFCLGVSIVVVAEGAEVARRERVDDRVASENGWLQRWR